LINDSLLSGGYIVFDKISLIDIAAAAQISVMDYLGEINWDKWHSLKYWYALVKSRPSFQLIIKDNIPGLVPPQDYRLLDI
jgi:glutathione S-transferase